MNHYRIAICDDQSYYRENLLTMLNTYALESGHMFNIHSYSSGSELLSNSDLVFNIIILDIELDKLSGIEVARKLREQDETLQIIFVTSHESYAFHAYELDAIAYQLKPISYTTLKKQMDKALITIEYIYRKLQAKTRYIELKIKNEYIKIDTEKILYIEKKRNTIVIYTESSTYSIYETLSNIHSRLEINSFIYIHQGYIINYNKILDVEHNTIILKDFIKLPLSRKYYKSIKERFIDDILKE